MITYQTDDKSALLEASRHTILGKALMLIDGKDHGDCLSLLLRHVKKSTLKCALVNTYRHILLHASFLGYRRLSEGPAGVSCRSGAQRLTEPEAPKAPGFVGQMNELATPEEQTCGV